MSKKRFTLAWLGEKEWLAMLLWFGLSMVVGIKEFAVHNYNNYTIFKHVYLHTINGQTIYGPYPDVYFDVNNYGVLFSVLIAPFALMPDWLGSVLWVLTNAAVLMLAIRTLPLGRIQQNLIMIFASHELMAASSYFQFNPIVAACIIFGYTMMRKEKDFWAACFIMFAAFTKLYGIVGLAFFFFSRHKLKLIGSLILWSAIWLVLPMAISSPEFVLRSYREWYEALVLKNDKNAQIDHGVVLQDISAMGFIKRTFRLPYLPNIVVMGPALVLFAAQYIWLKYCHDVRYQLLILCSTLLFTVLYSSSSESPTYIIAFPAACIWFMLQPRSTAANIFFVYLLIGTSFSHSDLVTAWVKRNLVVPYAAKAMPSLILWLLIVYQILSRRFLRWPEPGTQFSH